MLRFITRFGTAKINKVRTENIPTLKEFMQGGPAIPYSADKSLNKGTYFIESYGCQMNTNDTELVRGILSKEYQETDQQSADIVMLNTCAIRESAEQKIYQRINELKKNKIVAVLGCMAERIKEKMIERGVHVVCGPDSYRELPRLLEVAKAGEAAMNVQLSVEETYAQITPIRKNPNSIQAYVSIMRGCNNMCSFCIVPFVRGRERSRSLQSILTQIGKLVSQGVKQITFLGQNVNSYHDVSDTSQQFQHQNSEQFSEMYKIRSGPGPRFAQLLDEAASTYPQVRFRFTSPHPKDFPDEVINVMAKHPNICKNIHLPVQSGSTSVLKRMRRNHTREAYLKLVEKMRAKLPGLTLSTDVICGFCGETEQQFADTISLLKEVKFEMAFLFAYSMRPKTHAHRNLQDDVPQQVKQQRLQKMIQTFLSEQGHSFKNQIGKLQLLLIEGSSKKGENQLIGRADNNMKGFIANVPIPRICRLDEDISGKDREDIKAGDYVVVRVKDASTRSLFCEPIGKMTLGDYSNAMNVLAVGN